MLSIPLIRRIRQLTETTEPINPLTISSATLSSTNPNGTLIIDTTQAVQDKTSTITVTATDTANGTKTSQTFDVTVGAYGGPDRSLDQFQAVCEFLGGAGHSGYPRRRFSSKAIAAIPTAARRARSPTRSCRSRRMEQSRISTHRPGHLTYTPDPGYGGLDSIHVSGDGNRDRRQHPRRPSAIPAHSRWEWM